MLLQLGVMWAVLAVALLLGGAAGRVAGRRMMVWLYRRRR